MNYTVYADDDLIFNRRIVGENGSIPYNMIEPTLNETCDKFNYFTYKALKNSPAYEKVAHVSTRIKIYCDGELYWTGRVFNVAPSINNLVTITCEDMLGVLSDSIVRPYSWNGTVSDFLQYLVNQHNSQTNNARYMISAIVCDITDNIVRSSEVYETTWGNIKQKLIDIVGGYMWLEYDENENAVLYYSKQSRSQIHSKSTQPVKFAKNIMSYTVDVSASELYTACVPLGYSYEVGEGSENDPKRNVRLTIESVNDGKDYLVNQTAAEIYGIIYAPIKDTTWDDVTLPENLVLRGQEYIQNRTAKYIRSINLSSADLSGIDADVPSFEWLDLVPCVAPDFNENMVIKSLKRDIGNPHIVSVSFGDKSESLVGKTASNATSTAERIATIESDYVTNGEARVVAEETIENSSTIQQLPEQILSTVSERYTSKDEFTEFSQLTQTQISQLPNEFQILFTQVLEGAGLTELQAYLRVLNGNLHLGRSNSEIKACLKNEVLLFYTGADELASIQTALAYFSSGKLYVKTVQIQSLTIGYTGALFDIRIVGEGANRCLFFSGRTS